MSEWVARRVWTSAEVVPEGGGWSVRLDGRPVRTPGKRLLVMPTERMARAAADEWAAQGERVDPTTMPVTRSVNSAIDKVVPQKSEVAAALAAYGETDLVCYRAEGPDALTFRQAEAWDPLLDWAGETFGARLQPVAGVMPRQQDPVALRRLSAAVDEMDAFSLTGFHDLVVLSGSLVLALAVFRRSLLAEEGWRLSRIDEDYQSELWGRDEEAERAAAIRREAFLAADRFVALSADPAGQPQGCIAPRQTRKNP